MMKTIGNENLSLGKIIMYKKSYGNFCVALKGSG